MAISNDKGEIALAFDTCFSDIWPNLTPKTHAFKHISKDQDNSKFQIEESNEMLFIARLLQQYSQPYLKFLRNQYTVN